MLFRAIQQHLVDLCSSNVIGEGERGMRIPIWVIGVFSAVFVAMAAWLTLLLADRNPLPFPDPGSRIFSAASPEAKDVVVELLAQHGVHERFQADSSGIRRSIMWDGTIINFSPPDVSQKLGLPSASIGLVASDPEASAREAAEFLRSRGYTARVVLDAEPELPIAFVVTDAMVGTVINFRKPISQMPRPE